MEYLLEVESAIPIEGDGWYEEGSNVVLEAATSQGGLLRRVFKGWEGDVVSDNERISFQMDGPKNLRAGWSTDFTHVYFIGIRVNLCGMPSSRTNTPGLTNLKRINFYANLARATISCAQSRPQIKEKLANLKFRGIDKYPFSLCLRAGSV